MNWVDLVVFGVAGLSALFGFARGLVRELLGIGAWVGAAAIAAVAFPFSSAEARSFITDVDIADAVAVAAVFLVCLVVLSLIASSLGSFVRNSALGGLDRSLGLVFGLARGAVLVIIAYIAVGFVETPAAWPPVVLAARALPYAYEGADYLVHMLPRSYRPHLEAPPAPPTPGATALLQANPRGSALAPPSR